MYRLFPVSTGGWGQPLYHSSIWLWYYVCMQHIKKKNWQEKLCVFVWRDQSLENSTFMAKAMRAPSVGRPIRVLFLIIASLHTQPACENKNNAMCHSSSRTWLQPITFFVQPSPQQSCWWRCWRNRAPSLRPPWPHRHCCTPHRWPVKSQIRSWNSVWFDSWQYNWITRNYFCITCGWSEDVVWETFW